MSFDRSNLRRSPIRRFPVRRSPVRLAVLLALALLGLGSGCEKVKALAREAGVGADEGEAAKGGDEAGEPAKESDREGRGGASAAPMEAPPALQDLVVKRGEVSIIAVKDGETEVPARFDGVTGDFTFRDGAHQQGLSGSASIDLARFDSGLPARDQNVVDVFFEVSKHRSAQFQLTSLEGVPEAGIAVGYDSPATATGKLTVHGQTVDVSAKVRLSRSGPSDYHVDTTEPIALSVAALHLADRLTLLRVLCDHKSVEDTVRVNLRVDLGPAEAKVTRPPLVRPALSQPLLRRAIEADPNAATKEAAVERRRAAQTEAADRATEGRGDGDPGAGKGKGKGKAKGKAKGKGDGGGL